MEQATFFCLTVFVGMTVVKGQGNTILPSKIVMIQDLNTPPSMKIQMDKITEAISKMMPNGSSLHKYGISERLEEEISGVINDSPQRHKKHIVNMPSKGTINSDIVDIMLREHFPYSKYNRTAEIVVLLVHSGTMLNGEKPPIMNLKKTIVIQFGQKENISWTQQATRKDMAFLVSKPGDLNGVIEAFKELLGIESWKVCDTTQYCLNVIPRAQLYEQCHCLECNEICRFRLNNETLLSRECLMHCSDDPHMKIFDGLYMVDETNSSDLTKKTDHLWIIGLILGIIFALIFIGGLIYYCKYIKPKTDIQVPIVYHPCARNDPEVGEAGPNRPDTVELQDPEIPGGQGDDVPEGVVGGIPNQPDQGQEQDPQNPAGQDGDAPEGVVGDNPNQPNEYPVQEQDPQNSTGQDDAEGIENRQIVNGEDEEVEEQVQIPVIRVEEQVQVPVIPAAQGEQEGVIGFDVRFRRSQLRALLDRNSDGSVATAGDGAVDPAPDRGPDPVVPQDVVFSRQVTTI